MKDNKMTQKRRTIVVHGSYKPTVDRALLYRNCSLLLVMFFTQVYFLFNVLNLRYQPRHINEYQY